MLAFAERRKNPWDCSGDKLPPVDLRTLGLSIRAYGRPLYRITSIRRAFGAPLVDRDTERRLQALGLLPATALPLPIDCADLLFMVRKREALVALGLLGGLSRSEIAGQLDEQPNSIDRTIRVLTYDLGAIAHCLGCGGKDVRLNECWASAALGRSGYSYLHQLSAVAGVTWHDDDRCISPAEFGKLWVLAVPCDDESSSDEPRPWDATAQRVYETFFTV